MWWVPLQAGGSIFCNKVFLYTTLLFERRIKKCVCDHEMLRKSITFKRPQSAGYARKAMAPIFDVFWKSKKIYQNTQTFYFQLRCSQWRQHYGYFPFCLRMAALLFRVEIMFRTFCERVISSHSDRRSKRSSVRVWFKWGAVENTVYINECKHSNLVIHRLCNLIKEIV